MAIQQRGHLFGNHGYNHRDPWLTSTDTTLQGIVKTEKLLNQFGITSVGYRPAYGHWKPLWGHCPPMSTWLWSIDMKDYAPRKSIHSYNKRVNKLRKGDIVLLHDNPRFIHTTLDVLPVLANHCIQHNLILHIS